MRAFSLVHAKSENWLAIWVATAGPCASICCTTVVICVSLAADAVVVVVVVVEGWVP